MIAYFPKIYDDELLYSVLARFHIHAGYLFFESTKNTLFENKESTPIIEFINKLKPDVVEMLTQNMTMEEIIYKHTMFPFYARFYNSEKKEEALQSLINMESSFGRKISKKTGKRYLKYCPLCAKEDRIYKGEAIWYRKHQIDGISVCPIHECRLMESKVMITRDIRIPYITAEQEVEGCEIEYGVDLEIEISKYISKLMYPIMNNNGNVAGFINEKSYISDRSIFYKNVREFYSELTYLDKYFLSMDAIKKVLNGNNDNSLLIGLISFYLEIPVEELIGSYEEICKLERKKKIHTTKPKRRHYWKEKDEEYFLKIDDVIKELGGNEYRKPVRICISSVEKGLGISKGSLKSMRKCYEYIQNKIEDENTYYAKRIIWSIKKLKSENEKITWSNINTLACLKYKNKDIYLKRAKELSDGEIFDLLNNLI